MACLDDGSEVPISLKPGTSSNHGSPNGSGPDLDGMGPRSFDVQFKELRDIWLPLARSVANYESHIQTITNSVVLLTSRPNSLQNRFLSDRLVFETRAKCQDFVAGSKDDGIPYEVDSPFFKISTKITVRQSKSLEDREIGRRLSYRKSFQNEMQRYFHCHRT